MKGKVFIISAPSGAGKTTLCSEILRMMPNIRFSVSYTTRKPRPGEVDGKDYLFVSEDIFKKMIEQGEFIEWAEVHGNLYGTSRKVISDIIESGKDVMLDIDVQGAQQMRNNFKGGIYIFVLPPSLDALRKRLKDRGQNSPEEIERRVKRAIEEIREYKRYDYVIVNDVFQDALDALRSIIIAEGKRMTMIDDDWIERTFNINLKEVKNGYNLSTY